MRSDGDLRIGLIGFGERAQLYPEVHRPGEGSRVVAVCDPARPARERARAAFPGATVTAALDPLLEQGLDAVMIFAPDDQHARSTVRALRAGIPAFCEKPIAIRLQDADTMLRTARETGTKLYVGHNMRHMPVVTVMRDLIQQGRIGEVKTVWVRHFVGHGGDYYFTDWHADRRHTRSLLLQKAAHDFDIIHWLAGAYTTRVSAMGSLSVYGDITDRRERRGERLRDWFSLDRWPPLSLTGMNPVIDVEDISLVNMKLGNGVLAAYQQCHFTPDYWRNFTVVGTEGRLENFGDTSGSVVGLWNRRHRAAAPPDESFVVPAVDESSHDGADGAMVAEFFRFVREGGPTLTSPVAARYAAAVGIGATRSLRRREAATDVPALAPDLVAYFDGGQVPAGSSSTEQEMQ